MLYTRKGDSGTSGLFGTKDRLPKDSPIFEALGMTDELNSLLGVCFAKAQKEPEMESFSIASAIRAIQQDLFIAQAELAGAQMSLTQAHVDRIEKTIGEIEEMIPAPKGFIIAGTTELSGLLDFARSVSRRVERRVVAAEELRKVSEETRKYLNRLSSMLYALARLAAQRGDVKEENPSY